MVPLRRNPMRNHYFILLARGIPRKEAQAILLQAFVSESLEAFEEEEEIYEQLSCKINDKLARLILKSDFPSLYKRISAFLDTASSAAKTTKV